MNAMNVHYTSQKLLNRLHALPLVSDWEKLQGENFLQKGNDLGGVLAQFMRPPRFAHPTPKA